MLGASIYLDHNSTTPIDPRVVEAMSRAWRDCGANPASQHTAGRKARRMLEEAREGILSLIQANVEGMDADQLIFTSGGTEANNLALFGLSGKPGDRVVVSAVEHPSILRAAHELKRRGWDVRVLAVDENGKVQIEQAVEQLDGAALLSIMSHNNETGIIQNYQLICTIARKYGVTTHVDAVQTFGKWVLSFRGPRISAMSIAPHKFHGPLGIGGLVLRHGVKLQPQFFGGFQQGGMRPGTENVALAIGFYKAFELCQTEIRERHERMESLRNELERLLQEALHDVLIIGSKSGRLPNTSCISFPGLDRQQLVMALDLAGVACSTGSACASGSSEPSPTLVAMGLPDDVIRGAIRLSLGAFTTAAEIDEAARRIIKVVNHLRQAK